VLSVFPFSCRAVCASLHNVADRVLLGLIPSSEFAWSTAVAMLKPSGGWMHVHGNVGDGPGEAAAWGNAVAQQLQAMGVSAGKPWRVVCKHVECVKSYAPHINHLVADVVFESE
jgi:tRNA G37 N-methylase Trm5